MARQESDDGKHLVLRSELGPKVAALALNRPEKLNAMSEAVIEELLTNVAECEADDEVHVIVIKGNGRAFSAGGDTSNGAGRDGDGGRPTASEDRLRYLEHGFGRFLELWDCPKPIIVQVHGYCLGIAAALPSYADLVVCSDDAIFGWPPPLGGGVISPSWAYHVGIRKAKEYGFLPASRLSGAEAARIGFANWAVPAVELDEFVRDMAVRIARVPKGLLRIKKEAINAVFENMGFRNVARMGATWDALAHEVPEVGEVGERVARDGFKAVIADYQRPSE
jgi:enoyl-CoA hydratase